MSFDAYPKFFILGIPHSIQQTLCCAFILVENNNHCPYPLCVNLGANYVLEFRYLGMLES